jgi:hypothetical protein
MYQRLAYRLVWQRGGKGGLTDRELRPFGIGFLPPIPDNSPNPILTDHLFRGQFGYRKLLYGKPVF